MDLDLDLPVCRWHPLCCVRKVARGSWTTDQFVYLKLGSSFKHKCTTWEQINNGCRHETNLVMPISLSAKQSSCRRYAPKFRSLRPFSRSGVYPRAFQLPGVRQGKETYSLLTFSSWERQNLPRLPFSDCSSSLSPAATSRWLHRSHLVADVVVSFRFDTQRLGRHGAETVGHVPDPARQSKSLWSRLRKDWHDMRRY